MPEFKGKILQKSPDCDALVVQFTDVTTSRIATCAPIAEASEANHKEFAPSDKVKGQYEIDDSGEIHISTIEFDY